MSKLRGGQTWKHTHKHWAASPHTSHPTCRGLLLASMALLPIYNTSDIAKLSPVWQLEVCIKTLQRCELSQLSLVARA